MEFGDAVLKATDLHTTILAMHASRQYAKLVFYLEACESGSMFKVLYVYHVKNTWHEIVQAKLIFYVSWSSAMLFNSE